jgi:hypothetical protein
MLLWRERALTAYRQVLGMLLAGWQRHPRRVSRSRVDAPRCPLSAVHIKRSYSPVSLSSSWLCSYFFVSSMEWWVETGNTKWSCGVNPSCPRPPETSLLVLPLLCCILRDLPLQLHKSARCPGNPRTAARRPSRRATITSRRPSARPSARPPRLARRTEACPSAGTSTTSRRRSQARSASSWRRWASCATSGARSSSACSCDPPHAYGPDDLMHREISELTALKSKHSAGVGSYAAGWGPRVCPASPRQALSNRTQPGLERTPSVESPLPSPSESSPSEAPSGWRVVNTKADRALRPITILTPPVVAPTPVFPPDPPATKLPGWSQWRRTLSFK